MNKSLKDHGPKPFVVDVEKLTVDNKNYRTVIWTGKYMQMTVMSIPPGEDIGLEIHKDHDQFIRIEKGEGIVQMGDAEDNLDFQEKVGDDFAILIPAGKWHNLVNNSTEPLKLYSIYSPVEHPKNTVHKTKQDEITKHYNGGKLNNHTSINMKYNKEKKKKLQQGGKTPKEIMEEARRNQALWKQQQEEDISAAIARDAANTAARDAVNNSGIPAYQSPPVSIQDPRSLVLDKINPDRRTYTMGNSNLSEVVITGKAPRRKQRPAPGNPQQTAPWTPRPSLGEPEVSVNPNLVGPDYRTMPTRSGESNNARNTRGNTRGVAQRVTGAAGQVVGGVVDRALGTPRQIYHGVAKGIHNLNHAAGRAVFGQTGETPAYPEYQHDRTFQTLGRNVGETIGHARDKSLAFPEALRAGFIDGGINLAGRGIHELNYGLGRAVFGQTGETPEYQPVNPAMDVVGYVRGMPGETFRDKVSSIGPPAYGELYGTTSTNNSATQSSSDWWERFNENNAKRRERARNRSSRGVPEVLQRAGTTANQLSMRYQQGGKVESPSDEMYVDFAVRYLSALGVGETEMVDEEGGLREEYAEAVTVALQEIDSPEFWEHYHSNPDEAVGAYVESKQSPEQVEMAKKGAKLKMLKKAKGGKVKKCKCGCGMTMKKEKGGKLTEVCSCGCKN